MTFTLRGLRFGVLVTSMGVCGPLGCETGPRRADFPTFNRQLVFSELDPSAVDSGRETSTWSPVRLPRGYRSLLPCGDGWEWTGGDDTVIALHHRAPPSQGGTLVVAVEQSLDAGPADRAALRDAALAVIKSAPLDTKIGWVVFGRETSASASSLPESGRDNLMAGLSAAQPSPGANVAAGLKAAVSLLAQDAGERRVLVLTSGMGLGPEAVEVASAIGGRGIEVGAVTLRASDELVRMTQAARGRTLTARDVDEMKALAGCAARSPSTDGLVDGWWVATALGSRAPGENSTFEQLFFISTIDPKLARTARLQAASSEALGALLDPTGSFRPAPASPDAADTESPVVPGLPTLGGGIGQVSRMESWSGWNWIGRNTDSVRLRFSSVRGTYKTYDLGELQGKLEGLADRLAFAAPAKGENLRRLAAGTLTELTIGYVNTDARDEPELGIAMLHVSGDKHVAATLARFLDSITHAPSEGRDDVSPASAGALNEAARKAGFMWVELDALEARDPAAESPSTPER